MYAARVDEKGRLKCPVLFQNFLKSFGDTTFFATSLDRSIGRIYPVSVWYENEKFFESYKKNPKLAGNVHFNAMDLGAEAEIDSQGRLLLSTDLRRVLGIENQTVRLKAYGSRVEIFSEAIYEKLKQEASENPGEAVDALTQDGLQ